MDINYYKQYEPIFGSWYITEKIGEGAYGQVFIIERHELGVVYKSALKALTIPQDKNEIKSVMSDGMSEAEVTEYYKGLVQNIVNEFIVMSRLKGNSHIVSYEDHMIVEHEDDIGWDILIRMELLTPLIQHTSEQLLEEREVLKLGIDICKALEFCRKYDLIHRDIKPENIFIAPSGDYKLGDFGIAKTVEKTRVGLSRKGTYLYMAPEVYSGEAYGATVDIYSLGIVMYKLLNNNRTPFMPEYPNKITYEDREESMSRRIRGEEISAPENGSEELKQIVLKACAFEAKNRFSTAAEMRRALEKLYYSKEDTVVESGMTAEIKSQQGSLHETQDVTEQGKTVAGKKISFNKKRITAAAVAAVLLIGVLVYAIVPKIPEDIIGINPNETIYIGDTLKPDYSVEPERFSDEKISFNSVDDSIITVNDKGEITAVGLGETTLTLTAGGYSEDVTVNVIAKVTEISGVDKTIRMTEGESRSISPKLSPDKFSDEKIIYKISDSSVASISTQGKISAKTPGSTILTISAGGCALKVKVEVEEYVEPVYTTQYNSGSYSSYSSGTSGETGSSSSKSSGSSGSSDGFFNSDDDEYFE